MKNILIVDDDVDIRETLALLLEEEGLKCQIATNGLDAWNFLQQNKNINCILLDLMMPIMNGEEFIKTIQESKNNYLKNIPIIIMTAQGTGLSSSTLEGYIILKKPMSIEDILSSIISVV